MAMAKTALWPFVLAPSVWRASCASAHARSEPGTTERMTSPGPVADLGKLVLSSTQGSEQLRISCHCSRRQGMAHMLALAPVAMIMS